ncbi:unnamed protein product [Protopolystoma xenopodis]|uniref:Uncharacterized protein n=1 Tax=Protopolystoma xenopodis TaxID=117903 RepID=A0A8J8RFV9_9PLAT|nr:unnamed protein product [Protopolystoma xenopodis]
MHPSNNVAIGQPGSTPGSAGHAALSGNRILLGAASDNCATTATSAVPTAATMTVTTNAATTPIGHMAHLQQQQVRLA